MARSRRRELDVLPRREELEALVHYYYHLRNEHKRAAPESSVRRRLEDRMFDVRERFDRLLDEWVPEEELREEWRAHIENHGPAPPGPPAIRPLVFRGVSDAASVVEVRGKDDEFRVEVDGALVERVAAEKDFAVDRTLVDFRLNGTEFHETFGASPEALQALADFLDQGGSPPWEYASDLLADGLIDVHFDLTPRGRRALARLEEEA